MQYNPEELNEILRIYSSESEEIIDKLNENFLLLEKNPEDKAPVKILLRLAHSLKGASRMLGFNSIQDISHKLEDILSFWDKEGNKINPDVFQEIYNVCDFLLMLVHKSVETKADYNDKNVIVFINKLDNFLTYNQMFSDTDEIIETDEYISSKSMDINAVILELMFILGNGSEIYDNFDEIHSVLTDNIDNLEEIFSNTKYDEIKNKISLLKEKILSDNFQYQLIKSLILDLRNSIYNLYKKLNIHYETNKVNDKRQNNIEIKKRNAQDNSAELIKDLDFIIDNLRQIKFDKSMINKIIDFLEKPDLKDNILKNLYSKVIKILSIIKDKDIIIDNECYIVLLQSLLFIKRYQTGEIKESAGNIELLLQRLNVVEDMFGVNNAVQNPIKKSDKNPVVQILNTENLEKNIKKIYDTEEIKVLRVDTEKIDNLIAQSGELLINGIKTREHLAKLSKINSKIMTWNSTEKKIINYLRYLEKKGFFKDTLDDSVQAFYKKAQSFFNENADIINDLNKDFNELYNIISEDDNKLYQTVMEVETIAKSIRVLPLASIFHTFPRMIRDIAIEKNKKIDLIISGSDTTVDKKIIEEIKMPLIHILRNAVSHGIELPSDRLKNNKNETGKILLTAKQVENNVIITIEDDGYGINFEKIKDKALKKGILTAEEIENITDEQLMKVIFLPGFSTQDSVSDISGRGIGLDVVKTKILNLNGEIFIDSQLNKGCKVTIKLPLSLSTIKTFILKVNNEKYAIPVNSIKYIKQLKFEEIYNKNGRDCIFFDNKSIPIFSLSKIFNEEATINPANNLYKVIVIEHQENLAAFIIEDIICEQEIFHKKFTPPIVKIKNIGGYTTLSTGEICLIINPIELINNTISNNNHIELKDILISDKQDKFKNKKFVLLDDNTGRFDKIAEDLKSINADLSIFNSVNSVYDYLCKNNTDYLICKIDSADDEVVRLIKYMKSDENLNDIKIIVFSDLPEYEIKLENVNINLYRNFSRYELREFINSFNTII